METKRKRFTDDDLIFILVVMFMFMLFGHNLRRLWEPSQEERERAWIEGAIKYTMEHDWSSEQEVEETDTYYVPEQKSRIVEAKPKVEKKKSRHRGKVTVTQYNPVVDQCDEDPLVTADNSTIDLKKLKKGQLRWVAVSRDLLETYKYGDVIELKTISGSPRINGRYIVHDTMHPRFTNRIDILTAVGEPMDMWCEVKVRKIEGV